MAGAGNKKGSARTPGSGRKKGTGNKSTKAATEILQEVKFERAGKKHTGYNAMQMQVMIVCKALDKYDALEANEPSQAVMYLKIAELGNSRIMNKEYGNIEIQKTITTLDIEDLKELLPTIEFIEGYKPIDDPDSNLNKYKDLEDDI